MVADGIETLVVMDSQEKEGIVRIELRKGLVAVRNCTGIEVA